MYVDELKVFINLGWIEIGGHEISIVMMLHSDSVRFSEIHEPSRIRGIKIKLACHFTKDE